MVLLSSLGTLKIESSVELNKLKWECGTMLGGNKDLAVHLSKYQWPCGLSRCIKMRFGSECAIQE